MKKTLVSIILCALVVNTTLAEEKVILKAGSIVPLQAVKQIKAADVTEGQTVDFTVVQDVVVEDVCVVPKGTMVKGKVAEARKSTVAGTKGRLVININNLILPNGEPLYFTNTDVRIYGKNRTPLSVVLGCIFLPCICIPGSKAVMPAGYEVQATVAANTTFEKKN